MRFFRADLSIWGFLHGIIAYLLLAWLAPQWRWNWMALLTIGLLGATASGIIFGLLPQARRGIRSLGFLAVSCLLPFMVVVGGDSLYYGRPYFAGPLTLGFIILWAILLLPFALIAALFLSRINK